MRYLRIALIPLVVAACSESLPTGEQLQPQAQAEFIPAAQPAVQEWIPLYWELNLCGYDDVTGTGTLHHSYRVVIGEDGRNHFNHVDKYSLDFIGVNTGDVWKYNDVTMRQSQWYETDTEYGPDAWMRFNEHVRIIGFDGAPSFAANNVVHSTVNANGDLVFFHAKLDPICE
jgi:hypothetical protein